MKPLMSPPRSQKRIGGAGLTDSSTKLPVSSSKYVVKPTNQNVKAYMQFKEQAKAIWAAAQKNNQSEGAAERPGIVDDDQISPTNLLEDGLRLRPVTSAEANNES